MKKILALLALSLAAPAGAVLCTADRVPAATLLFPFVTGRYASGSTPTHPVADRTAPTSILSITNVSSEAKIVHAVLWNDFGVPLLDWNSVLTGYDVVTWSFADLMEGRIQPTGPESDPATGRPFSPTGNAPEALGPVPDGGGAKPTLPPPDGVGAIGEASIFGRCSDPAWAGGAAIGPGVAASELPPHLVAQVYNGLRKSQVIAENQWWGIQPPYYVPPAWLTERTTDENVSAYLTVDVVAACGSGAPGDAGYFRTMAIPKTRAFYGNDP